MYLAQGVWSAPITGRLLFEAGFSWYNQTFWRYPQPGVDFTTYSITDSGTGLLYRAPTFLGINHYHNPVSRASLSYVIGSHAVRLGYTLQQGTKEVESRAPQDVLLTVNNGNPISLTEVARSVQSERLRADLGIFAQDQWTIRRLTLGLGLRFDYFNSMVPPQNVPAGLYVPARSFPDAVKNVPNWKDIGPRLGVAYDVFGDGKTAFKANVSRYVAGQALALATANNPVNTTSATATRSWLFDDGNYIPDCNLANTAA